MAVRTQLIIIGFLILATTLEVSGDALIRVGLGRSAIGVKSGFFLVGAVLLFGYGYFLNSAPIEFHRVSGVYIATLFIVWQVVSFVAFRAVPTLPVLIGGALIVVGGALVAFWNP